MKLRNKILVILPIFLLGANNLFALSYEDFTIPSTQSNSSLQSDKDTAKLLEKYIEDLASEVYISAESYQVENNAQIMSFFKKLIKMKQVSSAIQEGKIDHEIAKTLTNSMLIELKKQKAIITSFLLGAQNQEKNRYSPLIASIDRLVESIYSQAIRLYKSKQNISEADKERIRIIISIHQSNAALQGFGRENFTSKTQLTSFLQEHIGNIKKSLTSLREIQD